MQRLTQGVNQSAHLMILSGKHVLVIAQVDSPSNNVISVWLGARIPLFETASGAVLTAQFTDDRLNSYSNLKLATRKQRKIYNDNCTMMLSKHYCECPSLVLEGVVNISVPIHDHAGEVIAALTVPYIKRLNDAKSVSRSDARKTLVETGNAISNLLGASVV